MIGTYSMKFACARRAAQLHVLAIAEQDTIVPAQPRRLEREHGIDQSKDREIKAGDGWQLHGGSPLVDVISRCALAHLKASRSDEPGIWR